MALKRNFIESGGTGNKKEGRKESTVKIWRKTLKERGKLQTMREGGRESRSEKWGGISRPWRGGVQVG